MNSAPAKEGAVCFLRRDKKILLIHQVYPNGKNVWSGVGGMRDVGETLETTVVREGKEELGISINQDSLKKVGIIQETGEFTLQVFTATEWIGDPSPQEESITTAQWFSVQEIPYDKMWLDNKYWLPHILEGKLITAIVHTDIYQAQNFSEKDITVIKHPHLPMSL